jgi:DNA-binding MarR family transcriptional regulator
LTVTLDDVADAPWYETVVLPALLGSARRPYGRAIRQGLADAGFDDMPRRGAFVVGGIARNGAVGQQRLEADMGVSKQAASQLIDTLVVRGYVERRPDAEDRRRTIITLTSRGEAAADASHAAVDSVDALLAAVATADEIAIARRVLGRLSDLDLPAAG